ncbi:MAG TPA: molybdopterin molybdotransferase MoeA [Fibrobacteria bacterium]|nr:molybdopterin molybdotransferase MoeA [Fibrobacteria bacterium]
MASAFPSLLPVAEADRILAAWAEQPGVKRPAETVRLEAAAGRVLREEVVADRAYPAQDRARMDGIAVSSRALATLASPEAPVFAVVGLARAGDARASLSALRAASTPASGATAGFAPEQACVEIMTGAPLPAGCDTVIPYEDIEITGGAEDPEAGPARTATLRAGVAVRAGQFVHREGSDCAAGVVLVPAGTRLTAAHIAIAASVGMSTVRVARRPRVAVVATGDELVGVDETPLAHQLRVSNAHGLAALLHAEADTRVHRVGDDPAALAAVLRAVLSSFDMVLVSGGVSAGKFDAVPDTLESLGVRKQFHKLAQKPGKPLWFGVLDAAGDPSLDSSRPFNPGGIPSPLSPEATSDAAMSGERVSPPEHENTRIVPVFGLPGNPVSALVCARRFVWPFVERMLGLTEPAALRLALGSEVVPHARLTLYLPVKRVLTADGTASNDVGSVAEPRAVNGSGDFAALGASDGFVELPPSEKSYPAGARMAFFGWST